MIAANILAPTGVSPCAERVRGHARTLAKFGDKAYAKVVNHADRNALVVRTLL